MAIVIAKVILSCLTVLVASSELSDSQEATQQTQYGSGEDNAQNHDVRILLQTRVEASSELEGELKNLEDMEATLMRMVQSGTVGTPLKDFADLIMPHLDSMEEAINMSHISAQAIMYSFDTAFTACTTAHEQSTADTEASSLFDTKTRLSGAHKTCRNQEALAETNYSSCETSMNSLETAKTIACTAYDQAQKDPNINLAPQPGQGQSYRSWLVSVKEWVINELDRLIALDASCVNSTDLYKDKKLECKGTDGSGGLWKVHDDLKALCDTNQTQLESTTCSLADTVESSCSQYATCYDNANSSYNAGKASLLAEQLNRLTEYGLMERIKCFCNLFVQANGRDLSAADIDICKNATHSTAHLLLTLPTLPSTPGACHAVEQQPCTTSYMISEYDPLPTNAPAAACNVCPDPTTPVSTTTTQTPLVENENKACEQVNSQSTSTGKEDCSSKCTADSTCRYYSVWSSGWCRLSSDCNAKRDAAGVKVYERDI